MGERMPGKLAAQRLHGGLMGDMAQREHDPEIGHGFQLIDEEGAAAVNLGRLRLVGRGQAAHGVDDERAVECKAVFRGAGVGAGSEAGFEQRCVKQVSGEIAGEGSARAIGASFARREADDREPAGFVAEGRNRGIEPARFAPAKLGPVSGKARAERAIGIGLHGCCG